MPEGLRAGATKNYVLESETFMKMSWIFKAKRKVSRDLISALQSKKESA